MRLTHNFLKKKSFSSILILSGGFRSFSHHLLVQNDENTLPVPLQGGFFCFIHCMPGNVIVMASEKLLLVRILKAGVGWGKLQEVGWFEIIPLILPDILPVPMWQIKVYTEYIDVF